MTHQAWSINFLAQKNLHAIGLLHDAQKFNPFGDFVLSKQQKEIKINGVIIDQLKNYLIDLVVYGENRACEKCTIFEKIWNEFESKKYILRGFPTKSSNKDLSLNRCAVESIGFVPEKFNYGETTPGKPNDCTGP